MYWFFWALISIAGWVAGVIMFTLVIVITGNLGLWLQTGDSLARTLDTVITLLTFPMIAALGGLGIGLAQGLLMHMMASFSVMLWALITAAGWVLGLVLGFAEYTGVAWLFHSSPLALIAWIVLWQAAIGLVQWYGIRNRVTHAIWWTVTRLIVGAIFAVPIVLEGQSTYKAWEALESAELSIGTEITAGDVALLILFCLSIYVVVTEIIMGGVMAWLLRQPRPEAVEDASTQPPERAHA